MIILYNLTVKMKMCYSNMDLTKNNKSSFLFRNERIGGW